MRWVYNFNIDACYHDFLLHRHTKDVDIRFESVTFSNRHPSGDVIFMYINTRQKRSFAYLCSISIVTTVATTCNQLISWIKIITGRRVPSDVLCDVVNTPSVPIYGYWYTCSDHKSYTFSCAIVIYKSDAKFTFSKVCTCVLKYRTVSKRSPDI